MQLLSALLRIHARHERQAYISDIHARHACIQPKQAFISDTYLMHLISDLLRIHATHGSEAYISDKHEIHACIQERHLRNFRTLTQFSYASYLYTLANINNRLNHYKLH